MFHGKHSSGLAITAPFNNMQNLKFKSQPTVVFLLPSITIWIFVCRQLTHREKRKPTKITKWIEIHQSQRRTWPFDPVSTDRETFRNLQNGSKIINRSERRKTWPFNPVEFILFVFKDFRYVDRRQRKTQPLEVIWILDSACYWKAQ